MRNSKKSSTFATAKVFREMIKNHLLNYYYYTMKKILLISFLVATCSLCTFAQNRIQMQLLDRAELNKAAQVLGKMVFEDNKMLVYDTEGNLIAEPEISTQLVVEVNAENSIVTISTGDGEPQEINIEMGVDQIAIKGAQIGSAYRIYSINGTLMLQGSVTSESMTVQLQNIPAGTYLLVVNNNILKLLKP